MIKEAKVYLDGSEVHYIMEVDTEAGYLIKATEPIEADENECVKTEKLYGEIHVRAWV